MRRWIGIFGIVWGAAGVFGLLLFAILRLWPRTVEAVDGGLTPGQWLFAVLFCIFMAYTEGYRGFQTRFSPRTAVRLRYLNERPDLLRSLLAPLFSMGFFHATRRTRVTAITLTAAIVVFVILVQSLTQPWRGIIDGGVVIGLSWGVLSLGWWVGRAFAGNANDVSAEVPDARAQGQSQPKVPPVTSP